MFPFPAGRSAQTVLFSPVRERVPTGCALLQLVLHGFYSSLADPSSTEPASQLFLDLAKNSHISRLLHLLFPLWGILFIQVFSVFLGTFLESLFKCHIICEVVPTQPRQYSNVPHPILSWHTALVFPLLIFFFLIS